MNWNPNGPSSDVSRRSFLAAGATGAAVAASGCVDRVQSAINGTDDDALSLSIVTVPADYDRQIAQISRELEANLEAVGIDVTLEWRSRTELYERVMLEQDFDCYIGRHPAGFDPDFLYEALHSSYAHEPGWQNPFRYDGVNYVDGVLEEQRETDGEEREQAVATLLDRIAQERPFIPICFPEEHRVHGNSFTNWPEEGTLSSREPYLDLEPNGEDELVVLTTDPRRTENLNPFSSLHRDNGAVIDLLYDSLWAERDGEFEPRLAVDDVWDPDEGDGEATHSTWACESDCRDDSVQTWVDVTLRDDCYFHDYEEYDPADDDVTEADLRVTAEDVKFTYEFVANTAAGDLFPNETGDGDSPNDALESSIVSPAPRYRSHASAVEAICVEDDDHLRIGFSTGKEVAKRALTVPILPARRWRRRLFEELEAADFSPTEAEWEDDWELVTMSNTPAIGSGPFRYVDHSSSDELVLEPFEDHFEYEEGSELDTLDQLRYVTDPGSASSVQRVRAGAGDVTGSMLGSHAVDQIPDDVEAFDSTSRTFYHVGFNCSRDPFLFPTFRRLFARLIDRESIVENVFDGYAEPTTTPVPEDWFDEIEWSADETTESFVGSDGELDVDEARAAFENAGFQYDGE